MTREKEMLPRRQWQPSFCSSSPGAWVALKEGHSLCPPLRIRAPRLASAGGERPGRVSTLASSERPAASRGRAAAGGTDGGAGGESPVGQGRKDQSLAGVGETYHDDDDDDDASCIPTISTSQMLPS